MTDTAVPGEVSPGGITQIKKELDGFPECSPSNSDMYSPTTTVMNDSGVSFQKANDKGRTKVLCVAKIIFIANTQKLHIVVVLWPLE